MTWGIPNKHGKIRDILMLVHRVQGEEFTDLEVPVIRENLDPPAAVMPAKGLTTVDHLVIQIKRRF